MLSINTSSSGNAGFCDGISRRNFLRIGTLGLGGLTLPQLLRAESAAGNSSRPKSVIMIYLVGGPPHQDMFDLKPEAPKEIAGPWRPIATNVPGIEICEAFPKMAGMMDKFVPIRSIVGSQSGHDAIQVFNGFDLLLLLSGGHTAYCGPSHPLIDWISMGSQLDISGSRSICEPTYPTGPDMNKKCQNAPSR